MHLRFAIGVFQAFQGLGNRFWVVGASSQILSSFTAGGGAKVGSSAVATKPVLAGTSAVGK